MVEQECFLHGTTRSPPVHTTAVVKDWFAARAIQVLPHPPPPPPPADFSPFRKVKEELAGLHLIQKSHKSVWEGVMRTIAEDEFATVFRAMI